MSSLEKSIYKRLTVPTKNQVDTRQVASRTYRGTSTVNPENSSFTLFDIALIKQDLINHFHIRKGEKLENPEFGTIIWDALFEPMTEEIVDLIAKDVTEVINYDPRIQVVNVTVDTFESGIQIECEILFLPYSIAETLRLRFDQENGLIS